MDTEYLPRAADRAIQRGLAQSGCVRILGPRGIGKTRTAQRQAAQSFDLSSPGDRDWLREFGADVLRRGPYPILIDEWQVYPDVLWEVKRVVDERRGQFIVAGSPTWPANDTPLGQWPLTARTVDVEMTPMSVSERFGEGGPTFLKRLFDGDGPLSDRFAPSEQLQLENCRSEVDAPDIFGLLDLAQASGYPALVGDSLEAQWSGLGALVNTVIGHDVQRSLSRDKFVAFLVASAVHSSKPVTLEKLMQQADVARKTAESYVTIATSLGFTYSVGLWDGRVRADAYRRARRFFSDPGLCAYLASDLTGGPQRDSDYRGALLETFVAAQLRAETGTSGSRFRLRYFRDEQGEPGEVDLVVLDAFTDSVACIEVKARSSVNRSHAANIARVRDTLCGPANNGPRFAGGVVLHAGHRAGRLGSDDIVGLPMSALWSV